MPASRTCSECRNSLIGKPSSTKTCSASCRQKRARRQKRAKEHLEPLADAVNHRAKDALHEVVKTELGPIVRESIGQDVLVAIDKMMRLTPKLIDRLEQDLDSTDDQTRGRAMSLLARYTLGNQAVMPQPDAPTGQALEINFNVPRPEDAPALEAEAEEVKACTECGVDKPASEFLENSTRCRDCDAALRAQVAERFGA